MVKLFWVNKAKKSNIDWENNILQEEIGQVALDILESSEQIIILAPIAWVELDDIDLAFEKNILIIKWFRQKPEIFTPDLELKNSECFWWKFERNIILPENLDFETIKASLENNLLIITIDKLKTYSKNIKINKMEI